MSKIKEGWVSLNSPLKAHIIAYSLFGVFGLLACATVIAMQSAPVTMALFTGVASFCLLKSYIDRFF